MGESCFEFRMDMAIEYASHEDQMRAILNVIGTPDESEIAKFNDEKIRKYLNSLP